MILLLKDNNGLNNEYSDVPLAMTVYVFIPAFPHIKLSA